MPGDGNQPERREEIRKEDLSADMPGQQKKTSRVGHTMRLVFFASGTRACDVVECQCLRTDVFRHAGIGCQTKHTAALMRGGMLQKGVKAGGMLYFSMIFRVVPILTSGMGFAST